MKVDKSIRLDGKRAAEAEQISKEAKKAGIPISMNAVVNMAVGLGLPKARRQLLTKSK